MRIGPIPRHRISRDNAFRGLGLSKEEPVKPALSDLSITPLQSLDDRHRIDDHQSGDTAWVIHCQTEADMAATIMAHHRELIKVKLRHQLSKIIGNCALRLLAMIISNDRLARLPIAAHVWADDGESCGDELRCHPMPGCPGPGMAMDQEYWRPFASEPHPQPYIPEIDQFVDESFEHGHLPSRNPYTR